MRNLRMINTVIFSLIIIYPYIDTQLVRAGDNHTEEFSWNGGTKVEITAYTHATELKDGDIFYISITVKLLALNEEARDIHDIEVRILLSSEIDVKKIEFDALSNINASQTEDQMHEYKEEWGYLSVQLQFYCREDIAWETDPELISEWKLFLEIDKYRSTSPINFI
ncbi:unnamed protein product, partial [marine sediment metagenome]